MQVKHSLFLRVCLVMLLVIYLLALGCGKTLSGSWQYKEISRFPSPDNVLEVVVMSADGGATTSKITEIYILPKGADSSSREKADLMFAADHINGLKVQWRTGRIITVQFDEARILAFKNYWSNPELRIVVEAQLAPRNPDTSLRSQDKVFP